MHSHNESSFSDFLAGNQVDAIHVTQLERDTVLVCLDSKCDLSYDDKLNFF